MKHFNHVGLQPLQQLDRTEFNGKRYYTAPSGKRLPSVTTFLSHFKGDSLKKWEERVGIDEARRIKTRASIRGTQFHSLMESYLGNRPLSEYMTDDIMPDMKQSFSNMGKVLNRVDNIHYLEAMLYSETIGLAGQVDCIAEFDGIPSVIDFKTSLKLKKEEWILNYFEQCTAYSLMYEDLTGFKAKQIVVLISVDHEPEPQVFIKQRGDYMQSFYDKIVQFREETEL